MYCDHVCLCANAFTCFGLLGPSRWNLLLCQWLIAILGWTAVSKGRMRSSAPRHSLQSLSWPIPSHTWFSCLEPVIYFSISHTNFYNVSVHVPSSFIVFFTVMLEIYSPFPSLHFSLVSEFADNVNLCCVKTISYSYHCRL